MNVKQTIRKMEATKKVVAAERDKVRALMAQLYELEDLDDSWSRAIDDIESAIQTLSELV